MSRTLDFWFDFASTYSYPAAMRIGAIAQSHGVTVRWRPFLLGPVFAAQGWDTSPFNIYPQKGRYMWRDLDRICADLALPFRKPEPFPQNGLLAARCALIGMEEGWGVDFSRAVYRAEFGEGRDISKPDTIASLLRGLSLESDDVVTRAQAAGNKLRLRMQTEEAPRLGIFGAPTFVTADGELFWGNDRLETALTWAVR